MIDDIKKVLDLGFLVESPNYRMNTTNWGNGVDRIEYALHYPSGKAEYYYDDIEENDDSYKDAIEIIIKDLEKGWN